MDKGILEVRLEGEVKRINYRNEDNGWTVFLLDTGSEVVSCTGTTAVLEEGDYVSVEGRMVNHKTYGEQVKADVIIRQLPSGVDSYAKYLAKTIKGVGPKTAEKIVKQFGEDTFNIILNFSDKLAEISGLSKNKAKKISRQFAKNNMSREEQLFFVKLGISDSQAVLIKKTYGESYMQEISENPYRMTDTIRGIGFLKADSIAKKMEIKNDSVFRIRAGIIYNLERMANMLGYTYCPTAHFIEDTSLLLKVDAALIGNEMAILNEKNRIKITEEGVYLSVFYNMENKCADILMHLMPHLGARSEYRDEPALIQKIEAIENECGRELDRTQREAVIKAIRNNVCIITGGPGVGKTTTLDIVLRFICRYEGDNIVLAAPTGRAAKRMSEQTGFPASTIHRLIGTGDMETERIEADTVIVDEMSMIDISLFNTLISKIEYGTRVIFVGDVDQIPSVGPGTVLRDLIESGCFPVGRLTKIHRQAGENHIVAYAHRINKCEPVPLNGENRDFFFAEREEADTAVNTIRLLYMHKYPETYHINPTDVQILCPMKKGELGTEKMNLIIQEAVNPAAGCKNEVKTGGTVFREGDKIMHTKNNYSLEWYTADGSSGNGVFNGDVGFIQSINTDEETVSIIFDGDRTVIYEFDELDQIMLAYAITIHKSQGSEYPAVIIPLVNGGPPTLYNKNLLYTAVTRAKQSLALIGRKQIVNSMIKNKTAQIRYTGLKDKIIKRSRMTCMDIGLRAM